MPGDDTELLQAWLGGDRHAGQALIERHFDAVKRFFGTKAAAQADDLTQQTFLRCAEARERFSGRSTFRAFLFGIARNVLFEHYRRKARGRAEPDFSVASIADLAPGAWTNMLARDERQLLVRALQSLPLELQTLVELYYWEDLGVPELASVFEVPGGTIKSRLHRARRLLAEAMRKIPADHDTRRSVELMLARLNTPDD